MKSFIKLGLMILLIAAVSHVITVWAYPYFIMTVVSDRVLKKAGVKVNMAIHSGLPTPERRTVVMPSPDLIYSFTAFDVSKTTLRITAPVPSGTYWSLAFYGSNTDNFYHINDRQADTNPVDILLVGPNASPPAANGAKVVIAPSRKGVILARFLVKDHTRLDDLVKIQKQLSCKPIKELP